MIDPPTAQIKHPGRDPTHSAPPGRSGTLPNLPLSFTASSPQISPSSRVRISFGCRLSVHICQSKATSINHPLFRYAGEDRAVVIGRQLDYALEPEPRLFDRRCHVIRLHSHLSLRSSRLAENLSFLSRATVPVDDGEVPALLENCRNGLREPFLVWNTMKGVG